MTWNVLDRNTDCNRISACIAENGPDIAVFQELTSMHLACIRTLFPHVSSCCGERVKGVQNFIAIASVSGQRNARTIIPHADRPRTPSLIARLFGAIECEEAISVEVAAGKEALTVVGLHASAYESPAHRIGEIDAILQDCPDSGPMVLAGDFNSYSKPAFSLSIGPKLGLGFADLMMSESRYLTDRLKRRGLTGLVKGGTIRFPNLTLDHIFVRSISANSVTIVANRFGSDHHPVVADIAL